MDGKGIDRIGLIAGGKEQLFEVTHAERILRMPNNGGWNIPDDSPYKFDKKNGITFRANKGKAGKSESEPDYPESN